MRALFAGSPAIAVPALEALFELAGGGWPGFELAGVLTNPDSAKGRGGGLTPTEIGAAVQRLSSGAVAAAAGNAPVPLLRPAKLDAAAREEIAALRPDLLVSFAYGRIFGPKFLSLFPLGGINVHPSLLPKYRGPTPIPAAILGGERETGITVQRLALEMDSGDILLREIIPLNGRETTGSLSEIAAKKAAEMLPAALRGIASGTLTGTPQNHGEASYCQLITAEDGRVDWSKSAVEIDARVRAFNPWPLCWTESGDKRLFILKAEAVDAPDEQISQTSEAAGPGLVLGVDTRRGILVQTGEGLLAVSELQYSSKKALLWRDFLNGARNFTGSRLG